MNQFFSKALVSSLVLFLCLNLGNTINAQESSIEILSSFITSSSKIEVVLSQNVDPNLISISQGDKEIAVIGTQKTNESFEFFSSSPLDFTKKYIVRYKELSKQAQPHWKAIDDLYTYDGELGAIYSEENTEFKLWAPLASDVTLQVYDDAEDENNFQTHDLTRGGKGVWSITIEGDLHGKFYSYQVTNFGESKVILDPYAKSMAMVATQNFDIGKAAIVDPLNIGPELNFGKVEGFEKREDAIIWEIHVRDFTVDPTLELEHQFGTYKAFTEKLDYIRDLGVTHVQLLPVMNYALGDESSNDVREWEYEIGSNYNWGYDPHSYFAPEGMYALNPADPVSRVKELKELIQAIHQEGLGVTLDVVYNHTARLTILEDIVPGYYHFMDANGVPKESYGGGRVGTTHAMARKLVIDSILYWLEAYKVDGYRFDLMGDLDGETVQLLYDAALEVNPNVLMVGECWRTYAGDDYDGVTPADQDWMDQTNSVACFSDEMRNELKSGYGSEGQPRFITGGPRSIETIFNNIIAKPGNTTEDDPGDILQYVAAHDNLTLHDVIAHSSHLDPDTDQEEIHKRIRLGNTVILTSQGVAFIHAGQEYGRTKQWRTNESIPETDYEYVEGFTYPYLIENSYDASDIVNYFDWTKVTEDGIHKETMEYTKGLIALRKSSNAFRLGTEELVAQHVRMIESPNIAETDLVIGYEVNSTDGDTFYVFINADTEQRSLEIAIDLTDGVVLVDDDESGISAVREVTGVEIDSDKITINALTAVVIKK